MAAQLDKLRKKFRKKSPEELEKEQKEWWQKKQAKYRPRWDAFKTDERKARAVKEAKDEYNYRNSELREIASRTALYVSLASVLLAVSILFFQGAHLSVYIKVGVLLTGIAVSASAGSHSPPIRVLWRRFMPAEVWVGLIASEFDEYVKYIVRAERKTKVLDRYKRLHFFAARSLQVSSLLLGLAFVLR